MFDSRHAVQDLDTLFPGDEVWIPDHSTTGHVVEPIAPRSYHVSIPTGTLRCNHAHLQSIPTPTRETAEPSNANPHFDNQLTVTKSGHVLKPPQQWPNELT